MAVNNNTDIKSDTHAIDVLDIPESLLNNLSPNQQTLIKTLAANAGGLLSSELTRKIGVSNKSDLINDKLKAFLENEDLEIFTTRVNRQWLWGLRCKSTFSNKEGAA